jgi:hypothetical protein
MNDTQRFTDSLLRIAILSGYWIAFLTEDLPEVVSAPAPIRGREGGLARKGSREQ